MQVLCTNPKFIVSPSLGELLCRYHIYYVNDKPCYYKYSYRGLFSSFREFSSLCKDMSVDLASKYYVVDESTGNTFPIFMQIPCGHCSICNTRRINSFVSRCRMESQCYTSRPLFFTLTYDPKYRPDDGVSVDAMQKFMKRFRINLQRSGYLKPIRYCIVGEYGQNPKYSHAPHYHGIIWNLETSTFYDYSDFLYLLNKSWSFGFTKSRFVDPSNDKSFYYTSKYLLKRCFIPEGCNDVFMLTSRKNGGIGSQFIDSLKDKLYRFCGTDFKYFDKWTQCPVNLCFSSYVLNRVFPSQARYVGSRIRSAVRDFVNLFENVKSFAPDYTFLFQDVRDKIDSIFKDKFYYGVGRGKECFLSPLSETNIFSRLRECSDIIKPYLTGQKFIDMNECVKLSKLRDALLGRFALNPSNYDIAYLDNLYSKRIKRSYATLQL